MDDRVVAEAAGASADTGSGKWGEWVRAGLLTDAQVRAIGDYERAAATLAPSIDDRSGPPARESRAGGMRAVQGAVPEVLGYLGGLLVLGGSVALVGRVWDSVPIAGRVGIAAVAAVLLGVGGALVDEQAGPALTRLRAVLWTASTVAAAIAVGLTADEVFTDPQGHTILMLVGVSVGVQSGLMWAGRPRPAQLVGFLGAWPVVIGAASAHVVGASGQGLAIWPVGAVLLWLGLYRVRRHQVLWVLAGSVTMLVGAAMVSAEVSSETSTGSHGVGLVFALATALGLVVLGAGRGLVEQRGARLVLVIIGAVATLQFTPRTIGFFAERAGVATGLVVWLVGAGAVAAMSLARTPRVAEAVGAAAMVGGAAVIGTQVVWLALAVGLVTSIGLLVLGTRPERVAASLAGAGGLLIFVPWSISHFFPGEGRVPVLVTVTGLLILGVAVMLLRRRA